MPQQVEPPVIFILFKCPKCGSRDVDTMPDWPKVPGGAHPLCSICSLRSVASAAWSALGCSTPKRVFELTNPIDASGFNDGVYI